MDGCMCSGRLKLTEKIDLNEIYIDTKIPNIPRKVRFYWQENYKQFTMCISILHRITCLSLTKLLTGIRSS